MRPHKAPSASHEAGGVLSYPDARAVREVKPRTIKVYRELGSEGKEKCDLGCTHTVRYHSIKRITITHETEEFIVALHYTHDGWGWVRRAVDAQGRTYQSRPGWDGYSPWLRDDELTYWDRPFWTADVYRDATGRQFKGR